jgi:taurine--2-oxoglutarate transaminase
VLAPGLAELADKHAIIGEARGEGVFWALELVADPDTREPVAPAVMGRAKASLLERGLLPFLADNRIHVVPPCVVTDDEANTALAIYDEVFTLLTKELS